MVCSHAPLCHDCTLDSDIATELHNQGPFATQWVGVTTPSYQLHPRSESGHTIDLDREVLTVHKPIHYVLNKS